MLPRTLLLAAALLAACADDAETPEPHAASGVAADPDTAVTAGPDHQLFDSAFASVCRGTAGQPAAAAYAGDGPHPFLTLASTDGVEFSGTSSGQFPAGWRVRWPDLPRAQLVVCQTRISATPAALCEGFEDEDEGTTWSVQTHDAVYEVVVREARTAEVLGAQKFTVETERCPRFSLFSEGDPDPKPAYPRPSAAELEVFVGPFVTER